MENSKEKSSWKSGMAKNITFIVTKDCQLACKYCYLVGKNSKERMSWEVAKQAIDYVLCREDEFSEESVVWDFIGGEPFLEIGLIDRICDSLCLRQRQHLFRTFHPGRYRRSDTQRIHRPRPGQIARHLLIYMAGREKQITEHAGTHGCP